MRSFAIDEPCSPARALYATLGRGIMIKSKETQLLQILQCFVPLGERLGSEDIKREAVREPMWKKLFVLNCAALIRVASKADLIYSWPVIIYHFFISRIASIYPRESVKVIISLYRQQNKVGDLEHMLYWLEAAHSWNIPKYNNRWLLHSVHHCSGGER